jgi:Lon protease-like protein
VGDEAPDLSGFSGIVPMFPLPNVVLFPRMFLPLHIFEPRYRAMTRSVLDGERFLAMALLQPGWQKGYEGSPSVHRILGLGKIVEDTALEDGRFNLVLYGLARLRLIEEQSREPYRTVRVEVLRERPAEGPAYGRKRRLLLAFYAQVLRQIAKGSAAAPPDDVPLGLLCDLLASLIAFEPAVKQSLLEELDVAARCDLLLDLLHRMNAPGFATPSGAPARPWPPGPSLN